MNWIRRFIAPLGAGVKTRWKRKHAGLTLMELIYLGVFRNKWLQYLPGDAQ